ncbi:MAG: hypothetical protein GQ557_02655 [Mycoplasmataceae bacterium]|nr:hypothetical protein [Mycoplasmataceae bacterium]
MDIKKEIEKLTKKAKFELTDKEIELFIPELEKYLFGLKLLDKLNLSNVKGSSRPFEYTTSSLRDDVVEIYDKDLLKYSSKVKDGYFVFNALEKKRKE